MHTHFYKNMYIAVRLCRLKHTYTHCHTHTHMHTPPANFGVVGHPTKFNRFDSNFRINSYWQSNKGGKLSSCRKVNAFD